MGRTLVSVQRTVSTDELGRYDERWRRFRDAAVAAGAKAWRFRSAHRKDLYIEFLEFGEGADPRDMQELTEPIRLLNSVGAGESEEWTDANIP